MYLDQPLQKYLDDLASSQPTPGGGSAAALSGAMGAALASMVARLTIGKANYAGVQQEIEQLLQQTEGLRVRFEQLMQKDIDAYASLSASFKMPHTTNEERAARSHAIQERLAEAAHVPLEVAENAAQLVHHCLRIAEIANTTVLSDIAVASMLASSAGASAAWLVRVNLRSLDDLSLVNTMSNRLSRALDDIAETNSQVTNIVGERA